MVDITVPTVGEPNWGPTLNTALEALEGAVTTNETAISTLESGVSAANYFTLVAASNAPQSVKDRAQYVCDGSADNVEVQAAIDAVKAAGGGIVQLSRGAFSFATQVEITGNTDEDDAPTISLLGVGQQATEITVAVDQTGIEITDWATCHIADLCLFISGAGVGIHSTAVLSGNEVSFWHSSFKNLRINGGFNASYTGWAMDLQMPWRSVFENIEVEGTRNGIRLSNQGSVQNAGDCTFTRMFIEIVGTGGTAIHVSSPSNNMNQNNFSMVEAGANGTGCTGILIDGASGGASQRFWGLNLEQFQTLINVANGESNVFECNYVTCDTGGASNVGFKCGSNAYNNYFSAKWFNNASGDTVEIIEDNNTTSNAPNIFERIRVENNSSGTVTYTKQNNTVFRDITTFNTGTSIESGLLQYPLSNVNDATFTPADHGLVAWTHDPATLRSASNATTSGTVYLCKVKVVNRSSVATNVIVGIEAAGVTLTAGQSFVGLYNSSGTLLSASADQSGNWTSTGLKTIALGAPQTLAVGSYYVAILSVGATPPQFAMGAGGATTVSAGLTAGTARFLTGPTGQTSLPASITLSSQTITSGARWAALS